MISTAKNLSLQGHPVFLMLICSRLAPSQLTNDSKPKYWDLVLDWGLSEVMRIFKDLETDLFLGFNDKSRSHAICWYVWISVFTLIYFLLFDKTDDILYVIVHQRGLRYVWTNPIQYLTGPWGKFAHKVYAKLASSHILRYAWLLSLDIILR